METNEEQKVEQKEEKKGGSSSPFAPKTKAEGGLNKVALIGICAGIAVFVFVIAALLVNMIGAWKKPIKKYYEVTNKIQTMDRAYLLKEVSTKNAYKYTYKIRDKVKIKENRLEDIEDYLSDNYDSDAKVKAGYIVEVDYDGKALNDDDDDIDGTRYFAVIKVSGKWYVFRSGELSSSDDIEDIAKNICK